MANNISNSGSFNRKRPRGSDGYSRGNNEPFVYSLSTGFEWQPCSRADEKEHSNIDLNFNFWMRHRFLFDRDISNEISSILLGEAAASFKTNSPPRAFVFCVIRGVDPIQLATGIATSSPFLSSCSSVPVYHAPVTAAANILSQYWRSMDVQECISEIFWPPRAMIPLHDIPSQSVGDLLRRYSLTFESRHAFWTDSIVLSPLGTQDQKQDPGQRLEAAFQSLVQQKMLEGVDDQTIAYLTSPRRPGDILGRFKRSEVADSGIFLYRPALVEDPLTPNGGKISDAPSNLVLLWFKANPSILVEDVNAIVEGTQQQPVTFFGSQLFMQLSSVYNKDICTDIDIDVTVDMTATPTVDVDVDVVNVESIVEHSSSVSIEDILQETKAMYGGVSYDGLASLVAPKRLLSMMGYPMNLEDEGGLFVSTSSSSWRMCSTDSDRIEHADIDNDDDVMVTYPSEDIEEGEECEEESPLTPQLSEAEGVAGIETVADRSLPITEESGPPAEAEAALEVCAIDCEMCYTSAGLELTRVTIVCPDRGVVYDQLVKPSRPVLDYNTEFSGITEEALEHVTKTLLDVRAKLRTLISAATIIVGHSLDNDLRALNLIHHRIIDTAVLFPHSKGIPFKQSLKKLSSDYLGKSIQGDKESGHDSVQDAAIALQLALLKAKRGPKFGVIASVDSDNASCPRDAFLTQLEQMAAGNRNTISSSSSSNSNSNSSNNSLSFYTCPAVGQGSDWGRFALGYRCEADVAYSVESYLQRKKSSTSGDNEHTCTTGSLGTIRLQQFSRCHEAVSAAKHELEQLSISCKKGLSSIYLDLNCGDCDTSAADYNIGDGDGDGDGDQPVESLASIDRHLQSLFDEAPTGTLFMAITQGELHRFKELSSRRQRNRWGVNNNSNNNSSNNSTLQQQNRSIADSLPVLWSESDERDLIVASAHVIGGAMFLRMKTS